MRYTPATTPLFAVMIIAVSMVACEQEDSSQVVAATSEASEPAAVTNSPVTSNADDGMVDSDPSNVSQGDVTQQNPTNNDPTPVASDPIPVAGNDDNAAQVTGDGSQQQRESDMPVNAPRPPVDDAIKDENPDGPQTEIPSNPVQHDAENLRSELELVTSQVGAKFEFYEGELLKVAGNVQRTLRPAMEALQEQHAATTEAVGKLSLATPADFAAIKTAAQSQVDALTKAVEAFEEKLRDGLRAMDIEPDW